MSGRNARQWALRVLCLLDTKDLCLNENLDKPQVRETKEPLRRLEKSGRSVKGHFPPLLTVPSLLFLIRPPQEARWDDKKDSSQSPFPGPSRGTFRGSALLKTVIGQAFASVTYKHRITGYKLNIEKYDM